MLNHSNPNPIHHGKRPGVKPAVRFYAYVAAVGAAIGLMTWLLS